MSAWVEAESFLIAVELKDSTGICHAQRVESSPAVISVRFDQRTSFVQKKPTVRNIALVKSYVIMTPMIGASDPRLFCTVIYIYI